MRAQETQRQPQPTPTPTFSTDVKVANVLATVRDKEGHIVSDLTKDDFTVLEDGHPQTIRYFARQSDVPLTLGLLVDTSMSERRMLSNERQASYLVWRSGDGPNNGGGNGNGGGWPGGGGGRGGGDAMVEAVPRSMTLSTWLPTKL